MLDELAESPLFFQLLFIEVLAFIILFDSNLALDGPLIVSKAAVHGAGKL